MKQTDIEFLNEKITKAQIHNPEYYFYKGEFYTAEELALFDATELKKCTGRKQKECYKSAEDILDDYYKISQKRSQFLKDINKREPYSMDINLDTLRVTGAPKDRRYTCEGAWHIYDEYVNVEEKATENVTVLRNYIECVELEDRVVPTSEFITIKTRIDAIFNEIELIEPEIIQLTLTMAK